MDEVAANLRELEEVTTELGQRMQACSESVAALEGSNSVVTPSPSLTCSL